MNRKRKKGGYDTMKKGCRVGCGCMTVLIAIFVVAFGIVHFVFLDWTEPNAVASLPEKHLKTFSELIRLAEGRFLQADDVSLRHQKLFLLDGLRYVDGRSEDGITSFTFSSSNLEGSIKLYHSPHGFEPVKKHLDNILGFSENEFPDISEEGIKIEAIGMGGKGYLFYRKISPEWYLVDMYLPT